MFQWWGQIRVITGCTVAGFVITTTDHLPVPFTY